MHEETSPRSWQATQLVLHEREARDRGWWDRMLACFHSDAKICLSWFEGTAAEFVSASREMAARGAVTRHRLAPPTPHDCEDRALVLLGSMVESYPVVDGVEAVLSAHTRLVFRVERRASRWGICRVDCVYERDEMRAAVPGADLVVDPAELAGFRPSYRLLMWHLERTGFPARSDLPGDDRPEQVAALYKEAFDWLGGGCRR